MRKSIIIKIFIIIFLFGFILYGPALQGIQKSEWQGTIEKVNGITIIQNPKEPLYGEIVFELEEDLSIGKKDDENYTFKRVQNIQIDKHGTIYVLDEGNFRIQVFDKKGKYLQTIGKQGKKTGEFELPIKILVDETTGYIYVNDLNKSLVVFDLWGYHQWTTRLNKTTRFEDFNVDEDGNIFGALRIKSDSGFANTISKLNREGEILAHYVEHPHILVEEKFLGSLQDTYYGFKICLARQDYKTLIYGWAFEYKLYIIDNYGRTVLKFGKDIGNSQSDESEVSRFLESKNTIEFTKYFSILTDSKGRIYIQTNKTRGTFLDREIDLFSKDGYYLYKTSLPKQTHVIKNGYLYTFDTKGAILIKRYKIKNWDQIKEDVGTEPSWK